MSAPQLRAARRDGFSLVEVIVAIVVLTMGVLAMAAATGYVVTQVRIADLRSEREAAVQRAVEQLRAEPYDDLNDLGEASAETFGSFEVWWTLSDSTSNLKSVQVFTRGPGYRSGEGWDMEVQDTFRTGIARGRPQS